MDNKGFTLVELLMSLVILSLILLIAVPSYNGISNVVRKNQRENKIKNIEIAASKYAFDTGETIIFVDKLVTEGYIESDDEEGNIEDPLNNVRLNCYVVEMEKESDYYNAIFKDNKNYDNNGVCNLEKLQQDEGEIYIEVLKNGTTINTSNWQNGTISLNVYSNSIDIDCINNKCVWTSSSGASITGKDKITLDNITGTLNTIYTFQYTVYDDDSSEIRRYKSSVNLKIDNEAPTIYENEVSVTNKLIYTNTKSVTISASDDSGSGISGYYLALDNGESCYNEDISYQASKKFIINSNGSYLICVKDNVGNISSYKGLKITYIK